MAGLCRGGGGAGAEALGNLAGPNESPVLCSFFAKILFNPLEPKIPIQTLYKYPVIFSKWYNVEGYPSIELTHRFDSFP